jgi:hypothetical protein
MRRLFDWTPEDDAKLCALRREGLSWDAIAARIGATRWSTIERGRKLGAKRPVPVYEPPEDARMRGPLPAGHPASWEALTRDTLLDGAPYPYPVFF